jgi:hypothetical protein
MRAVTRDEACVSKFALDRWVAGELSCDEAGALQVHLETCARCSLRCDELGRQRAAFLARVPSWDALDRRMKGTPRRRQVRWAWTMPLVAAAGLLAIGVAAFGGLGSHERQTSERSDVRSKGGPSIGFFVKRGEQIRRGSTGEVVAPGELVRFTYSSEQPAYFGLLHADAAGASVYYPREAAAAKIGAGRDVPLDFSIRLDALLGAERVYGLFCAAPIALEPVRAQLERTGQVPELPHCRVDPLVLNKRLP